MSQEEGCYEICHVWQRIFHALLKEKCCGSCLLMKIVTKKVVRMVKS